MCRIANDAMGVQSTCINEGVISGILEGRYLMNAESLIVYSCDDIRCGCDFFGFEVFVCPRCHSPRINGGEIFNFTHEFAYCIQDLEYRQSEDPRLAMRYSGLIERLSELKGRLVALHDFYCASDIASVRERSGDWSFFCEQWHEFDDLFWAFKREFDKYEEFKLPQHIIF